MSTILKAAVKPAVKPTMLAAAMAIAFAPIAVGAQEAAPAGATSQAPAAGVDVVVVTGVRKSLEAALVTKRNADSFVDAINSEDVGKLPDANIAEVLQRVPGLTIQRTRGEGDFVSIRGLSPNFVRGEVDGRTIVSATESTEAVRNGGMEASTGRSTNFDVLPAEIVQRVEVYKSPTAAMVEGGIGGVVNIITQDPLQLGNHYFLSANGTYRELNKAKDPDISGLASWRNDSKTFGVLADISHSKRTIRDDSMDSYGWGTPANWASYPDIDSTGGGTPNLLGTKDLSGPWTVHARQNLETRERTTGQVKAAWRFPDQSKLTANALYSRRTAENTAMNSTWNIVPNSFVDTPPALVPPGKSGASMLGNCGIAGPAAGGFCTVPGATASNGAFTSVPVSSSATNGLAQNSQVDSLTQLGLNYRKDFGSLHLSGDLSDARGTGSLLQKSASVQLAFVTPFVVSNDGKKLQLNLVGNPDLSSSGNYYTRGVGVSRRDNTQSEKALALNGRLDLENVPLSRALEFGIRLTQRDVDRNVYSDPNSHGHTFLLNGYNGVHPESNFGSGQFALPFNQLYFMTPDQEFAVLQKLDPANNAALTPSQFQPGSSFGQTEKTKAFYVQDDLEADIAGMPLKGNIGVRGVRTEAASTGFFRPFTINFDPVTNLAHLDYTSTDISSQTYRNSYFNLLPVLNLELDVRDDLVVRFAAGKSLTRPDFATQLAPALTSTNVQNKSASAGNPSLNAYTSTNIDLGVEWYLAPSSALWVTGYSKDISNFIAQSTVSNVERFGYVWNTLTTPENQGSAKVHGVEIGYQQVFKNGFGYVLNGTRAGSSAHYSTGTLAGKVIPFDGVSKTSYNAAVFYEKDGFNARLAYGHRSSYVLVGQDVFGNTLYNDAYGQFDASTSYAIDDHWTFVANVVNLTNKANRIYTINANDSLAYELVGRRVGFGLRAKF